MCWRPSVGFPSLLCCVTTPGRFSTPWTFSISIPISIDRNTNLKFLHKYKVSFSLSFLFCGFHLGGSHLRHVCQCWQEMRWIRAMVALNLPSITSVSNSPYSLCQNQNALRSHRLISNINFNLHQNLFKYTFKALNSKL